MKLERKGSQFFMKVRSLMRVHGVPRWFEKRYGPFEREEDAWNLKIPL